ncbi:Tetraacyldisaccharide 4'-kinase [compost metagenome]
MRISFFYSLFTIFVCSEWQFILIFEFVKLTVLRYILLPFSIPYWIVMWWRNRFYDWGLFKSVGFDVPVICIGNLAVGGAGKTPATEYLTRLLAPYKVAILSRGYGRKTKGFICAAAGATADQIGDEPLQYFHKFPHITVAVCENRVEGINRLKARHDVILLDDAYQHRAVKAGFNLLLFEYSRVLKWQFPLPAGNLREPFSGYKRADAVLITKSPALINRIDRIAIHKKIDLPVHKRICFSFIQYGALQPLYPTSSFSGQHRAEVVFVLCGIANPKPLYHYLDTQYKQVIRIAYPDHHRFTRTDLEALNRAYHQHPAKEKIIITTEKDSKRLLDDNFRDLLLNLPIFYLPIEMELAPKDKFTFDKMILDYVASVKRIG